MASWTGHPDPAKFPGGTAVKLFAAPKTPWSHVGRPPGAEVTEATVAGDGSLTFTGLTEGVSYLGWATVGGVDQYLTITVATASATGAVTSVNGKEGAVTLTAADVEALGAASPALTGVPTAPTAVGGTNTTQLASNAFVHSEVATEATARASGDTTETSAREAADALKAPLASPALTGTPKAPTASALTNTTQVATTAYADAAVAVEKSRAETAEALKALKLAVHASVVTNGTTATVNQHHPVNDEAESRTIKLPAGEPAGSIIGVEKSSAAAHEVEIEGSIRGEAAQTLKLRLQRQTVFFLADAAGSWWPLSMYIPLATLSTDYVLRTISVPAGQVPGNELLAEWKIRLHGTEKRTIVSARIRTSSGTINVAIQRGEAGATEIAAYKALKGASTEEEVTSEQALSDKDRIAVTSSGGATPKGLFIDIWEKVEK
jgi:hypothetical protein